MAKQLSLPERIVIEQMIHKDFSFASIGRNLDRSASTIAREVLHYRCFTGRIPLMGENNCIFRPSCQKNTLCPDVGVHVCFGSRCKRCPDGINCTSICDRYDSFQCDLLDNPPYVCSACKMQKGCQKNKAFYSTHRANAAHHKSIKVAHSGVRKTPSDVFKVRNIDLPKKVVYRQRRIKKYLLDLNINTAKDARLKISHPILKLTQSYLL